MEVWKMTFLFNLVIFRFHVNFQGCTPEFFAWAFFGIVPRLVATIFIKTYFFGIDRRMILQVKWMAQPPQEVRWTKSSQQDFNP